MARSGLDLSASDTRSLLDSALAQADRMRRAADDLLLASGEEASRVPVLAGHVLVIVRSAAGAGDGAPPEVRADPKPDSGFPLLLLLLAIGGVGILGFVAYKTTKKPKRRRRR